MIGTGLLLGGLTSFLQTWLPSEVAPLANSAGPWCVVGFVLAGLGRRPRDGAILGAAALAALDAGYYLTASERGFPAGASSVAFWVLAALVVGPVLGIGACWLDARHPARRACAVAVLPTVLVLEGVRSFVRIGDTTYRPYWVAETALGLLLAAVLATWARRARPRPGDGLLPAPGPTSLPRAPARS